MVVVHFACLTFDFDALSSWLYRGLTTPTAISRGEFGAFAVPRLLELLARKNVSSTWFIPGHTIDTYPEACAEVVAAGHEVGHHGYLHEPPAELDSREREAAVLERGIECIRRLTGKPPRGYRSPSWDLSPHTVDLLLEHGFGYDSSLMATDHQPYAARRGDRMSAQETVFGEPTRLLELPVSWSLDDYPHFEYVRAPRGPQPGLMWAGGVLENWVGDFRFLTQAADRGVLVYTFHPEVIGRGHRMLLLERLIDELKALGANFVRMEEAAEEFADCLP